MKGERFTIPAVVAVLLGVVVFGGAFMLGRSHGPLWADSAEAAAAADESGRTVVTTRTAVTSESGERLSPGAEVVQTTTSAPSTTLPPSTTTTAVPLPPGVCDPETTRSATLEAGLLTLEGEVPAKEVADQIVFKATQVLGEGNVINNYRIVPGASIPNCAPVLVKDNVLFEFGSAQLRAGFEPLLGLGSTLMELNPAVTITVVGHTDSISTRRFNQGLSERRALAVINYWTEGGVDPSRITAIGKGEDEPLVSNQTEAGRSQNRRVEFQITGLLGQT